MLSAGGSVKVPLRAKSVRASAQGGFTMIELLVALTITMIALSGLMALYVSAAQANGVARQSAHASDLGAAAVDELRSFRVSKIETLTNYATISVAGWGPVEYHEGSVLSQGIEYHRFLSAVALNTNLVRLKLDVTWSEDNLPLGTDTASEHTVSYELIKARGGRF